MRSMMREALRPSARARARRGGVWGGGSVRGGDDRKRGPGRDQPQGAVAVQGPQGHSRRGKFLFFVIFLMMNGDV